MYVKGSKWATLDKTSYLSMLNAPNPNNKIVNPIEIILLLLIVAINKVIETINIIIKIKSNPLCIKLSAIFINVIPLLNWIIG